MNRTMINYNRVADGIDKRFHYVGRDTGRKIMNLHEKEYIKLNKKIKLF